MDKSFLPTNLHELYEQGFDAPDFVMVSGDAYVDHPSFGHAVVARLLQAEGFGVGIIAQPRTDSDFKRFDAPKHAFLISGGVVDSMVNNYTVSKKRRTQDDYSEGGVAGKRPDRTVDVYSQTLKRLFPETPVIIGGIEASLRRLSHYDYWDDNVRHSVLKTSGADLLIYGMGENPLWEIASYAKKNIPLNKLKDIRGTAYLLNKNDAPQKLRAVLDGGDTDSFLTLPPHNTVASDKKKYCLAFVQAKENSEYSNAKTLIQKQDEENFVVVNPPALPLTEQQMDKAYSLAYMRKPHPMYKNGVPAIEEVEFSVTAHRGCYGNCSFCALTYHQGRSVQARSSDSIISEVEEIAASPDFKGYIHDIGGPSANFHTPSCERQKSCGICTKINCIGAAACRNLKPDHSRYLSVLRRARAVKGVKKVFVRSGLRFDYLLADPDRTFFRELVQHHVSGQLKVAPEHCSEDVLKIMNKPSFKLYKQFTEEFAEINKQMGKNQFLVPYFISSHPGCTLKDAVTLTEYLKSINYMPKQVQDFYPTPSTLSTTMYYTEMDPYTLKPVYVAKAPHDKALQRALLQYRLPQNRKLVEEAYQMVEGTKRPQQAKPAQTKTKQSNASANFKTKSAQPKTKQVQEKKNFRSTKTSKPKNKR